MFHPFYELIATSLGHLQGQIAKFGLRDALIVPSG